MCIYWRNKYFSPLSNDCCVLYEYDSTAWGKILNIYDRLPSIFIRALKDDLMISKRFILSTPKTIFTSRFASFLALSLCLCMSCESFMQYCAAQVQRNWLIMWGDSINYESFRVRRALPSECNLFLSYSFYISSLSVMKLLLARVAWLRVNE